MSLRLKTILGIAAIEAVLLIVLVTTVLNYMRGTSEESLIQRAKTASALFATTAKDAVLSYDLASLESFSLEVMKNPGMVYARVLGPNGEVFAAAGDENKLQATFSGDESLRNISDGVYDTYALIEEGGAAYGRVEIGLDISSIDAALAKAKKLAGTIALVEMLLVALFSFVLGAYLTRQLKSLRHAARTIASGDLCVEVDVKGKDEISEVAGAFNRMIGNLKISRQKRDQYERELVELNKTLEDRVERRTISLQEKNDELSCAYEEIKRAQAQAMQSEKMASVGQLAAGVAHEINNPVGFVSSNLESLSEYVETYQTLIKKYREYVNADDNERVRIGEEIQTLTEAEDIDFINDDIDTLLSDSIEGTTRVRDIVQGLKDFSHVDNATRQPANLNQCLESTLKVANNELKYNCEVTTDFGDIPDVDCNPGQLNQVFLNLIVNAAHATGDDGIIKIKSERDKNDVVITITDNGKGISKKHLDKLFEPFFTTKPVGQGTGLGLSIAYGIIQDHSGDIAVRSKEGVGTRFTIRLPAQKNEGSRAA